MAVTVVIIVVLVGGYVGLTVINGNQPAATPTPSATPQVTQIPQTSPTASPSPELTTQEQARDAAIAYIIVNHPETTELMENLSWIGGRATPDGLVGYETYVYNSANWTVAVGYPITFFPQYEIAANYSAGEVTVAWAGTYTSGAITETSYNSSNQIWLTEKQLRDAAMTFIQVNHNETVVLITNLSWAGGNITPDGLVGYVTYVYNSANWTVTLGHPVIPYQFYTITANYSGNDVVVAWEGTYVNGTLTETSYSQNSLIVLIQQEQIRDAVISYIRTQHSQTAPYMQDFMWSGGMMPQGMMLGSSAYSYQSNGWNMTMRHPVVPNPIYTITANYTSPISEVTPKRNMIMWSGTWQNGTITETGYTFTP